jgi:Ras-related protein Rab-6A
MSATVRVRHLRVCDASDARGAAPLQALFRKIAAALPGMEALSSQKQEELVHVKLAPSQPNRSATSSAQACSC